MLSVTEKAIQKIKETYDITKSGIRIVFNGFGWGGPRMGMALDESKKEDKTYEKDGIKFILSPEISDIINSYGQLNIDYKESFFTKGFRINFNGTGCC